MATRGYPRSSVAKAKVKKVMHEWGQGELHSGSKKGPLVAKTRASQAQAVAIALSEARKAQKRGRVAK